MRPTRKIHSINRSSLGNLCNQAAYFFPGLTLVGGQDIVIDLAMLRGASVELRIPQPPQRQWMQLKIFLQRQCSLGMH